MSEETAARTAHYAAFISYSHIDKGFASWLQRRLETYALPRRLVRIRGLGPGRDRRVGPIFRDRASQSAAADITAVMRQAIAESRNLIVVCSPASAVSSWVGREIQLFRQSHPGDRVLAALFAGEAPRAFHPAMVGEDGDGSPRTPLAADFRRGKDGRRLALLKLVAVIVGVRLEELIQRDAQRRVRRIAAIAIAAALGMTLAGVLAMIAVRARAAAEREGSRGRQVIEFMLTDLRGRLKRVGRLDLLDVVNRGAVRYYSGQNLAALPDAALAQRAELLSAIGQDEVTRGRFASALAEFEEARRTTGALLAARPTDLKRVFDHSQSEYYVGLASWRLGADAAALAGFRAYAALTRRLVTASPTNADWQVEAGDADSNLGTFVLRRFADTERAEALFQSALAHFQAAARQRPTDRDIAAASADGYGWLGAVELVRGDDEAAMADRLRERAIYRRLLASDPRDFTVRAQLVSNSLALGRVASAGGQWRLADETFRAGRVEAQALARAEPANDDTSREVRAYDLFQARTWLMRPLEERPPVALIAAMIGDCAHDEAKANNGELAELCGTLSARLRNAAVRAPHPASTPDNNRLSQRWLLDFRRESSPPPPLRTEPGNPP